MNARSFCIGSFQKIMKNLKTLFAASSLLAAVSAFGAGYQIIEQGAANMGNAMAGATANANCDASAAFWNPSAACAMPLEVGKTRVDSVVSLVLPTLCVNDRGSTPSALMGPNSEGSCGTNEVVPNFYVVHRFTEDLYGTLSVTAPYGLESKYNGDWFGRMQGTRSYLYTTDVNPGFAYRVNDWFSVGGGVSAQFAYCTLASYIPGMGTLDYTGQSWSVGGNIGFTVQYAEDGRFGFSWRSQVSHTLTGGEHLNDVLRADISADMYMPDTFTVGIYQRLRGAFREFAVMAEYAYTRWSVFEDVTIEGGTAGTVKIPENWEDTSRVALGFHYYPEEIENLTIRIGAAYDESPVNGAKNRTSRIPCSDRIWASCGIGYKIGNVSFDLAYSYIFVLDSSMDRTESLPLPTTLRGDYYAHIHVISAQIGFEF